MSTEEATVNADGSTTFEEAPPATDEGTFNATEQEAPPFEEEILEEVVKGTDPAVYLLVGVALLVVVWFFFFRSKKKEEDDFFSDLDGEKFNLKLPEAVEEYYEIKNKCLANGWEPGKGPPAAAAGQAGAATGPHRVMAQALMKRCIADIPIVTHIQKESAGMNKLYSQSMCSVKQWRAYQGAEAMVSAEVDEVRAEADEIEPGWSQVIWRQAMQYHNMLKQRHEMEAKAAAEAAKKKKIAVDKRTPEQRAADEKKEKELAAEKAAEELIKQEEREKQSQKAFANSGMKKGFLAGNSKKK